jgi:hypothetical protein
MDCPLPTNVAHKNNTKMGILCGFLRVFQFPTQIKLTATIWLKYY